ncbi:MAG: ABC transporter ATP-binding protein [Candidatus Thermoplasmatota archaeon]|nr:ABC transporter ATP-binding protein [Candidatus Thermoplasmatota archaeon]
MSDTILRVEHLKKHYQLSGTILGRLFSRGRAVVEAVDDVSFELKRGEVLGLVGESGCGKTTLGRTILRLTDPTEGTVIFDGEDITHLREKELRPYRRKMQIVFQDPHASLNPAMTVGKAVGHPLHIHDLVENEEEAKEEVLRVLREVGLEPAEEIYDRYPADLSGGQKQRVVIARAIILRPSLIVADEAVAMLDMSVRAKILELLMELKGKYGLTYLFITHDLATAKFVCHRIAIMYLGRIVEMGLGKEIYAEPWHPYTKALLRAIPVPDPSKRRTKEVLRGEVPDAIAPPQGCRFHPRCPEAFAACGWEPRDLLDYFERQVTESDISRLLGPLDAMSISGSSLLIPVKGGNGERIDRAVRSLLNQSGPISDAVQDIDVDQNSVRVTFREPLEPRDLEVQNRLVACHLFDPQVHPGSEGSSSSP